MSRRKIATIEKIVAISLILIGLIQSFIHIYYWDEFMRDILDNNSLHYLKGLYTISIFKSFSIKIGYIVAGVLLFKARRIGWIIAIITLSFTSVSVLIHLFKNDYYWGAPIIIWNLLPLILFTMVGLLQVYKKCQVPVHLFLIYSAIGIVLHIDSLLMAIVKNESFK